MEIGIRDRESHFLASGEPVALCRRDCLRASEFKYFPFCFSDFIFPALALEYFSYSLFFDLVGGLGFSALF